ncbi:BTAD domain-containing putative transcriptional regulator [Nonomuraea sp. B10E15]|uniref:BTAD domain-containing putative transcriptional regulator n=1 Tax=Nonomuraea sp. B10E15 TaxID=3153560 RepID=UPI00325E6E74
MDGPSGWPRENDRVSPHEPDMLTFTELIRQAESSLERRRPEIALKLFRLADDLWRGSPLAALELAAEMVKAPKDDTGFVPSRSGADFRTTARNISGNIRNCTPLDWMVKKSPRRTTTGMSKYVHKPSVISASAASIKMSLVCEGLPAVLNSKPDVRVDSAC